MAWNACEVKLLDLEELRRSKQTNKQTNKTGKQTHLDLQDILPAHADRPTSHALPHVRSDGKARETFRSEIREN